MGLWHKWMLENMRKCIKALLQFVLFSDIKFKPDRVLAYFYGKTAK